MVPEDELVGLQRRITVRTKTLVDLLTGVILATPKARGLDKLKAINIYSVTKVSDEDERCGTHHLALSATDGYRYHSGRTKEPIGAPWPDILISTQDALNLVKSLKGVLALPDTVLSLKDNSLIVRLDGCFMQADLLPLDYPSTPEHLFEPKAAFIERIGVDPAFMADLAKIPRTKLTPVVLNFQGQTKAITASIEHEHVDWKVAIMPMRLPVTE